MKNVNLIYECESFRVFDKPAGLPVQGGEGIHSCLDSLLTEEYGQKQYLVHRLDRDTSGLILVATSAGAASHLSRIIEGEMEKRYLALCAHPPLPEQGQILSPLEIRGRRQEAKTAYHLLRGKAREPYALLELRLLTGRTHQIRRHLSRIGCPILGDDKYGDFALNRRLKKEEKLKYLLLHSSSLSIPSLKLSLESPLPERFKPFLIEG